MTTTIIWKDKAGGEITFEVEAEKVSITADHQTLCEHEAYLAEMYPDAFFALLANLITAWHEERTKWRHVAQPYQESHKGEPEPPSD